MLAGKWNDTVMLVQAGLVDKVKEIIEKAGVEAIVYSEVPANPTFTAVQKGISMLAGKWNDTVMVTLGGGSAMDCGKAIAVIGSDDPTGNDIQSYTFFPERAADG